MNEIKIFESEQFGKIRTSGTTDKPLFCAIDVCNALLYTNSRRAIALHVDKEDVTKCYAPTKGGRQELLFVTESGLYSLIFGSKLERAKQFKRWVTNEILPAIRKTGSYGVPRTFAEALQLAADQQKIIEAKETEIITLNGKVNEMQPKATYYDQILKSKNTILITQIAKDYGYGAARFNALLSRLHIQFKTRGQWVLYAEHDNKGHTKSTSYSIDCHDGTCITKMRTEWTQRGRQFLYEVLKDNGILPIMEQ